MMEVWISILFGLATFSCLQLNWGYKLAMPDKNIETESFKTVHFPNYIVDKTKIIDELAKGKVKNSFDTSPRRLKPINMKMLMDFFESPQSGSETEQLLQGTNADKNHEFYKAVWSSYRRYPVVYVALKNVENKNYMVFPRSFGIPDRFKAQKPVENLLQGIDTAGSATPRGHSQENLAEQEKKIKSLEMHKDCLRKVLISEKEEALRCSVEHYNYSSDFRKRVYQDVISPDLTKEEKTKRLKEINDAFSTSIKGAKSCMVAAKRQVKMTQQYLKETNEEIANITQGLVGRTLREQDIQSLEKYTEGLRKVLVSEKQEAERRSREYNYYSREFRKRVHHDVLSNLTKEEIAKRLTEGTDDFEILIRGAKSSTNAAKRDVKSTEKNLKDAKEEIANIKKNV